MGRILTWGSLQLCQSLVNGLYTPCLMMGEVSLETSPKDIMIQGMINSKNGKRYFVIIVWELWYMSFRVIWLVRRYYTTGCLIKKVSINDI